MTTLDMRSKVATSREQTVSLHDLFSASPHPWNTMEADRRIPLHKIMGENHIVFNKSSFPFEVFLSLESMHSFPIADTMFGGRVQTISLDQMNDYLRSWCEENIKGLCRYRSARQWDFQLQEDAALFRLFHSV